ncbi:MAG: segregation/condensation protein A [Spirochaetia bacterium]|nr:segregation/condensation protein A [Spirochaetia bacterium]
MAQLAEEKQTKQKEPDGTAFLLESFEGPLDVLLYLIQKSEVNIYDIPISEITEQYLAYLNSAKDLDLGNLTQFYKMAADLLYIKSRMLLPVDLEFDEEYEDPRQELVERLLEYQKFRKYTELLTNTGGGSEVSIMRKDSLFRLPFDDEELFVGVTLQDLLASFTKLMTSITPSKVFNVYESVTVNEKIALMYELFETKPYITLEEVIVHLDQMLHIVCAFMAILDACKFHLIALEQSASYAQILIRKRTDVEEELLEDAYDEDESESDGLYPISEEEESEFFQEDAYQDDESGVATADDGRIILYDEDSEDEQILIDED